MSIINVCMLCMCDMYVGCVCVYVRYVVKCMYVMPCMYDLYVLCVFYICDVCMLMYMF